MVYFVSDVHLGLNAFSPKEREARFVSWLRETPFQKGDSLVLLGDIWDFWYEYRDVIPKEGIRVLGELIRIQDGGTQIYYFIGNHDIWCFSFFSSLGFRVIKNQPVTVRIGSQKAMLAHGDGLGGAKWSYRLMLSIFHNRVCQFFFSLLHPTLAFSIATRWSRNNRYTHKEYCWQGESERLYQYALKQDPSIDLFVFGHYHCAVDQALPDGARLVVLKDWLTGGTPFLKLEGSLEVE